MDEYMLSEAIPMHGRMIHTISGETKLLPYSGRKGEYHQFRLACRSEHRLDE
jgi:hypothetical protein